MIRAIHGKGLERLKLLLVVSSLAFFVGVAHGQDGQNAADRAKQRVYYHGEAHLESSRVFIHVYKTGMGHEHGVVGRLKEASGTPGATRDIGKMVFDMPSFQADTDEARRYVGLEGTTDASTQRKVTANMHSVDVLDVQRYPTATCVVRSARALTAKSNRGLPQWELNCDFTLHGVTRPLRFVVDAEEKNDWTHVRGGFSILQSDYGIKPYSMALGAIGVADRLDIFGDFWIAGTRLYEPREASPQ